MKSAFKKIRLPRKVMFIITGVVVLCGASGAFAVYSGKEAFLGSAEPSAPSLSGLSCATVETLKMRRNGQRWIRKYISTETAGGVDRVRTALRVAGVLASREKADLYQVVVLDQAAPTERAGRRGPAIGAEVLFAPDPTKLPGMSTAFVARYNDGKANTVGLFYGREIALSMDEIKVALTAMDDKADCLEPAMPEAAAGAEGSETGAHGEKAAAPEHGEPAGGDEASGDQAAGHGDGAAVSGDEAAGHGDGAAASENAEETPVEHGEVKTEKKGFFGSMIAMVLGDDKPAEEAEPAAAGHAAALPGLETAPEAHTNEPASEPASELASEAASASETEKPPVETDGHEKGPEAEAH